MEKTDAHSMAFSCRRSRRNPCLSFGVRVLLPVALAFLLVVLSVFAFLIAPASLLSPLIGDRPRVFFATIGSAIEEQIGKLQEWVESKAIR